MEKIKADVAVVGAGGMGSAALFYLSQTGMNVVGIDRFDPPHDMGSSHGETRIYRKLYCEHSDYVPLLLEAEKLLFDLQHGTDQQFFYRTPCLSIGNEQDSTVFNGALDSGKLYNLNYSVLDRSALRERYPFIDIPQNYKACIDFDAGVLLPEVLIQTYLDIAKTNGINLYRQTIVEEIIETGNGFEIIAGDKLFCVSKVLVTAGAWSAKLLKNINIQWSVTREIMNYLKIGEQVRNQKELPSLIIDDHTTEVAYYGIFSLDRQCIKGGDHTFNRRKMTDPDKINRNICNEEDKAFEQYMRKIFGGNLKEKIKNKVCMYTFSPDEHFVIDCDKNPSLVYACGFSGHGFKFIPIIGKILKNMIMEEMPVCNISFLSGERFQ